MGIIYFLVGICATTIGAISGLGGGVIIKPVLDMLGHYDISTVGILSSFTVFSMSVVSLGKSIKNKVKLEGKKTIALALGSILGGVIGQKIFVIYLKIIGNELRATKIQSSILFVLMLIVLILYIYDENIKLIKSSIKNKINNNENIAHNGCENMYEIEVSYNSSKDIVMCMVSGIMLGMISSFLGIGGGPLNVIVLMYLLDMDAKRSSIHSIFIIFFSQGSKLISVLFNQGFGNYNLEVLSYMIIGGISGGFLGSYLSNKMDKSKVKNIFIYCMIFIICFNLYNIIK